MCKHICIDTDTHTHTHAHLSWDWDGTEADASFCVCCLRGIGTFGWRGTKGDGCVGAACVSERNDRFTVVAGAEGNDV